MTAYGPYLSSSNSFATTWKNVHQLTSEFASAESTVLPDHTGYTPRYWVPYPYHAPTGIVQMLQTADNATIVWRYFPLDVEGNPDTASPVVSQEVPALRLFYQFALNPDQDLTTQDGINAIQAVCMAPAGGSVGESPYDAYYSSFPGNGSALLRDRSAIAGTLWTIDGSSLPSQLTLAGTTQEELYFCVGGYKTSLLAHRVGNGLPVASDSDKITKSILRNTIMVRNFDGTDRAASEAFNELPAVYAGDVPGNFAANDAAVTHMIGADSRFVYVTTMHKPTSNTTVMVINRCPVTLV